MNINMQISFYEETINVSLCESLAKFQQTVADKFFLESSDVKELIIYFVAGINKYLIKNEKDFLGAISFLKEKSNQNIAMKFDLEVSEKSRLFQAEVTTKKDISKGKSENDRSFQEKQDKIQKEILEKEKLLKQLIENEKKEAEKIEKGKAEKAKLEAIEKAKQEKDKEELKQSVSKAVIDALNTNLEKFKEELMEKALLETSKAIEKSVLMKSTISKSNAVHIGSHCGKCGMSPIVGNRYHCTVCLNYDLCDDCEEKFAESHCHGFIKFRNPKINIRDSFAQHKYHKANIEKLRTMKEQYDLSAFSEQQIYNALVKCKGKADEALESLFQ